MALNRRCTAHLSQVFAGWDQEQTHPPNSCYFRLRHRRYCANWPSDCPAALHCRR